MTQFREKDAAHAVSGVYLRPTAVAAGWTASTKKDNGNSDWYTGSDVIDHAPTWAVQEAWLRGREVNRSITA